MRSILNPLSVLDASVQLNATDEANTGDATAETINASRAAKSEILPWCHKTLLKYILDLHSV